MVELRAGELVGERYYLRQRLGTGVSAEVWSAHDQRLDRLVALKALHEHLLPDARSRERFQAEARAAAALTHPAIVTVHDAFTDGARPIIVFQLVDGRTLARLIDEQGRLGEREAARMVGEIAEGLAHAHAAGLVHRDVKPANIMIGPDGRARLLDFGIARSLQAAGDRVTQTGSVVGTLRYMAPERLEDGDVGPPADVFGLGAVLYEALGGEAPFPAGTTAELLDLHRAGPPPLPGVSVGLGRIVQSALQLAPARRPDAAALAAYLRGWLGGGIWSAGLAPTAEMPRATMSMAGAGRRPRRLPVALAAVAVVVAVLALIGGILGSMALQGSRTSREPDSSDVPAALPSASPSPSPSPIPSPTPSPTASPSPSPTPSPTPSPPRGLVVLSPADGLTVDQPVLVVQGQAPPGSRVVRDVPLFFDDQTVADQSGQWTLTVPLAPGENVLTFRIADDRTSAVVVRVFYEP